MIRIFRLSEVIYWYLGVSCSTKNCQFQNFAKEKKCRSLHRITNTARRGAEEPGAKRCTRSNYGLMSRQSSGSSKMQKDLLGQNLLVLATVGINSQLGILQDIGFLTAVWRVSNLSPASKPAILNIVVYIYRFCT